MAGVFRSSKREHIDPLPQDGATGTVIMQNTRPVPSNYTSGADAFLWGCILMGILVFALFLVTAMEDESHG